MIDPVECLGWWAARRPDRGFEFIRPGATPERLGFASLHDQVRRLATPLLALPAGTPALLLLDAGPAFVTAFLACAHARVVAVPLHPPTTAGGARKLAGVIARAQPRAAIATAETLRRLAERGIDGFAGLAPIDVEALGEPSEPRGPAAAEDLLFLQFTSGSTAEPKGVRVTYGNLSHNTSQIRRAFAFTAETSGVTWLPPQHDMGLIGGVLMPVLDGLDVHTMSPADFLRSPRSWLDAISSRRVTVSGGPNFAYAYAAERITDEQLDGLDLSAWQVAFCGAEPVQAATLQAFVNRFAPVGFRASSLMPCYGLAEATLFVSGRRCGTGTRVAAFDRAALERGVAEPGGNAGVTLVGSGPPADDLTVAIVDPERLVALPDGEIGEVWVQGASIAAGYAGDEALTRETFHATLAERPGHWLRTGDLAFLHDGELWITGRRKDLIIVRGRNIHPQDIEAVVASIVASPVPSVLAFSVPGDSGERVVIVCGVDRRIDAAATTQAIRAEVSQALQLDVDTIVLVSRRTIPRTTSGKLQRSAARQAWLNGSLEQVFHVSGPGRADVTATLDPATLAAADTDSRAAMLLDALIRQIAAVAKVEPVAIDPDRELVTLGLDSLQMVELKLTLDRWIGREFALDAFLDRPSVRDVAHKAAALLDAPAGAVAAAARAAVPTPAPAGRQPPGPAIDTDLLTAFVRDPFALLTTLVAEHGPFVEFRLGDRRIQLLADPADVQTVLVERAGEFGKGDAYRPLARLMGRGLVTSPTDEVWREQRRAAQPLFGKQTIDDYTPALIAATRHWLDRWSAAAAPVDLLDDLRRLSLDFVLGELLDTRGAAAADIEALFALVSQIEDGIDIPSTFYALSDRFDPDAERQSRFGQAIAALGALVDRLVADHLARPDRGDDFITLLSRTAWVQEGDGDHARAALRDGVISLIFAGVGTSSSATFWALYHLSRQPGLLERVEAELAASLRSGDPDETILRRCPELVAVIYETLRLHPPIWWINREALMDTQIGEWAVPRGTTLFISPYVCHRDPARWPEPETFLPERFRDIPDPTRLPGFLPFGLGRRGCIGGRLAIQQMAVILPLLLQRFRFRPIEGSVAPFATTLSLVPRARVRFALDARVSP